MSESKMNQKLKSKPSSQHKPILLVSDKEPSKKQEAHSNNIPTPKGDQKKNLDIEMMKESIKVYEEQLLKKEDELQRAMGKIDEGKQEAFKMQLVFDIKLNEIIMEKEKMKEEYLQKEGLFEKIKESYQNGLA